jgi:4-hydroxyproline epimerase
MVRHTFFCIDGHTAGNPVRLVVGGVPLLKGGSMAERRLDFLERFDWIRTGLCFEPRGHDMMSGGFLYPPCDPQSDFGILFIETSGCLPMCGHGTIGIVTFALEHGLVHPRVPGKLVIEVPAGTIEVSYAFSGERVSQVQIRNVPSYLAYRNVTVEVPDVGPLVVDIAFGGNFYAIVEPQPGYPGLDALDAARIIELSRSLRALLRDRLTPVHPVDDRIRGVSHVMWTDQPTHPGSHGRNAVFYGERAIDRSPCGTGTSARMAQLHATGRLGTGEVFIHESYIASRFVGRIEAETRVGDIAAVIPLIEGSAVATGFNTIWIDEADPFRRGFTVE